MKKKGKEEDEKEDEEEVILGNLKLRVLLVRDPSEEILLLWALQQPALAKQNQFVDQTAVRFHIDACGYNLCILQAPSCLSASGVTGGVMWDSGVILAKFLEHAVDAQLLHLQGKKCLELGAGCGLVGCVATLLGAQVVFTDLPDRLRLLHKNVNENLSSFMTSNVASIMDLKWGDEIPSNLFKPSLDYVFASDVVYNEDVVPELLSSIRGLCSPQTTVLIAGELRNDSVLERFLELALKDFQIGRIQETSWHPSYRSQRVAIFVMPLGQGEGGDSSVILYELNERGHYCGSDQMEIMLKNFSDYYAKRKIAGDFSVSLR
ncbi:hypothetical protein O6H91_21G020500 [Diphasiastrum complanatum]|uniref:Uncharacterized protein n=1 Tax=Diphasiastrum complanatum TaxID=34168 RepID=A0ACC2AIK6_DIPCM|nr:hypothetical protein O6H91_21G020500 [Diphasiastrum complanatum]